jgi:hypothetical protein
MTPDLVSAEYIDGYRIKVLFADGRTGEVDCVPFIRRGGVYAPLADLERFKRFRVDQELGVLCWQEEIDIAPETLYALATGAPLPEWMHTDTPLRKSA